MYIAKTKALISFAVICAFVFAYVDCWFSHEEPHIFKKKTLRKLAHAIHGFFSAVKNKNFIRKKMTFFTFLLKTEIVGTC